MAIKNRKLWFLVHGWLSLPVWAVFCFVCLTGTISVISHELTWIANPAARAANPDGLAAKPLSELADAVRQSVPEAEIGQVMVYEPYLVPAVRFAAPGMPNALAYVNPYTAEVQAINEGITFIGFMRALHGWMLFPWHHGYSVGYYLVSAMSIVVLGAMITGLVIYKRFWRALSRPTLRVGAGSRVLLGDLHRLAGAWSLWFLLVIGATGLWYLTQAVLWHNEIDVWKHPDPVPLADVPFGDNSAPPAQITLADALARAREAIPSMQPAWATLPEYNRGHYSIAGSGDAFLFDEYSYRVFVHPWSGEVVETRTPERMNMLQVISHIADPLHYGTFGGLWTKAIWFVFGLLLTSMSITGFLIWIKRTSAELRTPVRSPRGSGREHGTEVARS